MIGFRSLYKRGWFLVTVAAVLRLTMVWVLMAHSPSWGVNEAAGIARQLVSGKGFASPFHDYAGPTAWLAPVYPVLLTGVFHIFGDGAISLWVAVLLNVVFGSLTTAVVLQLGRGFFGQTSGILAAWMWAVSPPMIVMPWLPWETCFSALMFGFVFLRTLRLGENSPLWQWILCGALWSFAALLNPALLAPLPALAFRAVRKPQCRIGSAAMLMVCLLGITPWTLRNLYVFHQFVPLRSNFWPEAYFGNVSFALHPTGASMLYQREGEIAFARDLRDRVIEHVRSHPREFVLRTGKRILDFWTQPSYFRFYSILIAIAAVFGLLLACCTEGEWFSFASVLVLYPLLYYFTYTFSRYRHPIEPVMYVLAGSAFAKLALYLKGSLDGKLEG